MIELQTALFECPGAAGEFWHDNNGVHINAHGGGILKDGNRFYWYGEHKISGVEGNLAWVGVHVYVSENLVDWRDGGIAFDIRQDCPLKPGCVVERPKVVRNPAGKYVMWFHLEWDKTYSDAQQGVAVADSPEGPFRLLWHGRPNPGVWAENTPPELKEPSRIAAARRELPTLSNAQNPITPEISVLGMDFETGQQSRDMTVFVDDDQKAYVVYSAEKNSTIHLAELDDSYIGYTGRYWRLFPWRWMEAPVLFKRGGKYYFIGSDCTGWDPNEARSAVADHLTGPWTELGNPAIDAGGDITYGGQGTFALQLSEDEIIFMADRWNPENAVDGRYLWLPIEWKDSSPILRAPATELCEINYKII